MASPSTNEAIAAGESQKPQASENRDLLDLYQRRGARTLAMMDASRSEKKHDVDGLSDKDLERITISLKDEEEDDNDPQEKKSVGETSRSFRHYTFVKRWEPLSSPDESWGPTRSSDATLDVAWFIASPEVLPEDDPAYLCDMCRHIDFKLLLSQRGLPSGAVRITVHGLWRVMQEENSCSFCRMLRQKITGDGLVSGMTAEEISEGGFYLNVVDEGPERALRLEVELEDRAAQRPERFLVHKIEELSRQPLAGRIVRQDHADMGRLRNWLGICEETHQVSSQGADPDLTSLRVIDTEELCIKEVEMPFRYSCLSYVWGKGSQTHDPSLGRFANRGIAMDHGFGDAIMSSDDIDLENFRPDMLKKKASVFKVTVDAARDFMSSLGEAQASTPWDLYRLAVDDYTKRKLSWESDAVDAFGGVEHIVRQGTNAKFWYGLPSFAFERSLMWNPGEVLERRSLNGKSLFPSWSWAAWRGHVSYRGRGWKNSICWEPLPVIRWMVRVEPKWIIENFKESGERTEEEVEEYSKRVAQSKVLLRELNPFSLYHMDDMEDDGWAVEHDEGRNRHVYSHPAYQNARFTYPASLPGQTVDDRPDGAGMLYFMAHAVPVVACDMAQEPFKMEIEDRHLQIGYNDEDRSANYRPPWQRIVYHQGYRAGTTWPPSRAAASHTCRRRRPAGTPTGARTPIRSSTSFSTRTSVPNETAEPRTAPPDNENGDPHWDEGRFNGVGVIDVYDVLLLRDRDGVSERIGGGKVNYCAFWAARPEEMVVTLA
ncbi:uncharacterized protein LY79DRAFT_516979 [Colletotrichum navitas]|uniref:Heterokaryon incompatibility domain-containing protein n=1 Tax=Colletotrichum navitas TaxID=681940 RepID=A0AAD8PXR9_9PEZI|nr:uncharacterized protein LY79DRAFT_516979 [Colletotrichum navitas]KAK1589881.1 hypothetical protein LY79DRAFT_516979 [Colletotrichum navitas]